MILDYRDLTDDQLEELERATCRVVVQALQEYSSEAKEIFDDTPASSETEVIVLAEDILQYALEVAELYPINKRYAGFIDYKRVRWFPTHHGLIPQALLVDAKASTENNRDTLQQSQLSLDAEFRDTRGTIHKLSAGVVPHLTIATDDPEYPVRDFNQYSGAFLLPQPTYNRTESERTEVHFHTHPSACTPQTTIQSDCRPNILWTGEALSSKRRTPTHTGLFQPPSPNVSVEVAMP